MTYEELYEKMCRACPYAKKCHEECEECEQFTTILEKENPKHD